MTVDTWLIFITTSLILTVTPGPSIILAVVHSVKFGPKVTLFTALGDISANFIQMTLVAISLGALISISDIVFMVIKWFGVATLCYMGGKMYFTPKRLEISNSCSRRQTISPYKLYISGFVVAISNPKAIVFFTALLPQFIDTTKPLLAQMMIICPTIVTLDFICVMVYAITANRFLRLIHKAPQYLNRLGGLTLIVAAIMLSISSY